jgi:hypothetical protein
MDSRSKHEEMKEEGKIPNMHVFWEEQNFTPNWAKIESKDRLRIFEEVNSAETLDHLARIIENLADEDGYITGRSNKFSAKSMAKVCRDYEAYPKNSLTREFGIRQQAMYILYYSEGLSRTLKG